MSYLRPMGAAPTAIPMPVATAIPGYSILAPASASASPSSSSFRTIAVVGVVGVVGYLVYRHMKKKGASAPGATP